MTNPTPTARQQVPTRVGKVLISCADGAEEVEAVISGQLALINFVYPDGEHYSVTHIPTGFAVVTHLSREDGIALFSILAREGLDWNFVDAKQAPPETKRRAREIVALYARGDRPLA